MRPDESGGPSLRVDYAQVEALTGVVRTQGGAAESAGRTASALPADTDDATVDGALRAFLTVFAGRADLCGATADALATAVGQVAPDFAATDAGLASRPR